MARAAVLGTGIMGGPIARHLLEAGNDVAVWNRTRTKAEALGAAGARVAASPAEAVAGTEGVVTILADGPSTDEVMRGGALAAMSDGAVWVQMATVGVEWADQLAAAAREAGVAFVDAPVLGSRPAAEDGALTVLASGPEEERERVESLLEPAARVVFWLGEAGVGSRIKLVANGWILNSTANLAEMLALGRSLGADPQLLLQVIEGTPLDMGYAHLKGGMMLAGEFPTAFPLKLACKDLGLIVAAGSELDLAVTRATQAQYERALVAGHGDEDMSAVYRAVAE